jgi:dienelactone hydrolase
MMKKTLQTAKRMAMLLLALVMALGLLGCQKSEPMPPEDMKSLALNVVDLLCDAKIQEAYEATTPSLQYILRYDNFEMTWLGGVRYCGQLLSNLGVVMERWDSPEVYVVDVGVDFSQIGAIVRFLFNEYGEMTMMSVLTHDFHDGTPLPEGVSEKDIVITTEEGLNLHGKIALPAGNADGVPGVVLIPGSGAVDMDCPYGNIKIMRDLAYGLAEQGIASIRLNKRTYETTQVSSLTYSFDIEYLEDYSAAYQLLAAEPTVDSEMIYLLGHSQASLAVPMLDRQVDSAGFVILAGTNRYLWELIYDQNVQYLNFNPNIESLNALNSEKAKAEKLKDQAAMEAQQNSLYGVNSYYYWYEVHNRVDISQITKPVMILRGLDDFMTYQADWDSLLAGYENARLTANEYEGLSHVFAPSAGMSDTSDYFVDAHVSDEVISDVARFILGE